MSLEGIQRAVLLNHLSFKEISHIFDLWMEVEVLVDSGESLQTEKCVG